MTIIREDGQTRRRDDARLICRAAEKKRRPADEKKRCTTWLATAETGKCSTLLEKSSWTEWSKRFLPKIHQTDSAIVTIRQQKAEGVWSALASNECVCTSSSSSRSSSFLSFDRLSVGLHIAWSLTD